MCNSPQITRFPTTATVSDEHRRRLRDLASELTHIAARLSAAAEGGERVPEGREIGAPHVQALLDARYRRSAAFGFDLVQPGWSLLLVLYGAHLEGRAVRMARLATEAHVAMTTMLRWTHLFVAHGLAERRADATHARGVLYALTAEGAERVRRQLEAEVVG